MTSHETGSNVGNEGAQAPVEPVIIRPSPLSRYSTADLVAELRTREGVVAADIGPDVDYGMSTWDPSSPDIEYNSPVWSDQGPAIILKVID